MDIKDLKQKIASKNIKISVVGQGYAGLSIAYLFSKKSFTVYGCEQLTHQNRCIAGIQ